MWKALLYIVGIIVAVGILWYGFQYFRPNQPATGSTTGALEQNIFSVIAEQLTGGLSAHTGGTRAPIVTSDELGEFSPVAGMVTIEKETRGPSNTDALREYIVLRADSGNAQPINISGWSLQSMITNEWYEIPQGSRRYQAGVVNELEDIYLAPGEEAVIATKPSPVGISFRTNLCTGYLASVQSFVPPLRQECTRPREVLPPTVENIQTYGAECVDFAARFNRCTYLTQNVEGFNSLSRTCRQHLQPRLTYNFCADQAQDSPAFYAHSEWRVFLNERESIWSEDYEVIRLLDSANRTVDVFTY